LIDWHEEVVERLAFPPGYLRHITSANPKYLAIISVKGRSMEPTLREDDVVMIDTAKRDLSFEGIFVIRDGGQSHAGEADQSGVEAGLRDAGQRQPRPPAGRAGAG
jgi:hypothetical protein